MFSCCAVRTEDDGGLKLVGHGARRGRNERGGHGLRGDVG